eukprot:gene20964-60771_t
MGAEIADYDRVRHLGGGAHGAVSLARRKKDTGLVAIKHVACRSHHDFGCALQEVDALMRLPAHPNLITAHTFFHGEVRGDLPPGTPGSTITTDPAPRTRGRRLSVSGQSAEFYVSLVMEYHHEGTLQGLLHARAAARPRAPLPPRRMVAYLDQLASLLAHIHAQDPPLVHRDLKPDNCRCVNVLVADGGERLVVTDFGIARSMESTYLSTQTGTLPYVAPECCSAGHRAMPNAACWERRYGTAADVWALGCIAYAAASLRVQPHDVRIMFSEARRGDFPHFLSAEPEVHRAAPALRLCSSQCALT